jgi:hypothetical protein
MPAGLTTTPDMFEHGRRTTCYGDDDGDGAETWHAERPSYHVLPPPRNPQKVVTSPRDSTWVSGVLFGKSIGDRILPSGAR